MYEGTIVRIVRDRGYGFISRGRGEPDLFFHVRSLPREVLFDETLTERRVEFAIEMHSGRERAAGVRLIEN